MYYITDKASYIRELQRLLGIRQSGRYDNVTRARVNEIKVREGLSADGAVDYAVFLLILDEYRKQRGSQSIYSSYLPIKYGDIGEHVGYFNSLMTELLRGYSADVLKPRGRFFGKESIDAVRYFRTLYRIDPESEVIDPRLADMLERDFSSK